MKLIEELEMTAQQMSDMEVEFGTENTGNELGKLCQQAADALREAVKLIGYIGTTGTERQDVIKRSEDFIDKYDL